MEVVLTKSQVDDFIDWIEKNKKGCKDFSLDILPNLINRVQTYHTSEVYLDIGTPESLAFAQSIFNKKSNET